MTITGISNIPFLLEMSNNQLSGAVLFGVIVGEIETPSYFGAVGVKRKSTDCLTLIDLIGIEVSGVVTYAKGQVFTVVNQSLIEQAKQKPSGRLAVSLRGGSLRKNKSDDDFVSFCRWTRGAYNQWEITSVDSGKVTKDAYPEFFDLLYKAHANNWNIPYPVAIENSYRPASAGYDFVYKNGIPFDKHKTGTTDEIMNRVKVIANTPSVHPEQGLGAGWSPITPDVKPLSTDLFNPTGASSFGTGAGSSAPELLRNKQQANGFKRAEYKIENRTEFIKPSTNLNLLEDTLKDAEESLKEISKHLKGISESDIEKAENSISDSILEKAKIKDAGNKDYSRVAKDRVEHLIKQLRVSWKRSVGDYTGRALFKEICERLLPEDYTAKRADTQSIFDEILQIMDVGLLDAFGEDFNFDSLPEKYQVCVVHIVFNRQEVYLSALEILLGLGSRLRQAFRDAPLGVSLFKLMETNPYLLCFVDPRFTTEDLDKLSMYNKIDIRQPSVMKTRNVAYMHNFILNSSNPLVGDSTIIERSKLMKTVRAGFVLSRNGHATLMVDGTIIKRPNIESIKFYLDAKVEYDNFSLPLEGWRDVNNQKFLQIPQTSEVRMLEDYLASGLGTTFEIGGKTYVSDFILFAKELYVYTRLYKMSQRQMKEITDEQLERLVTAFEKKKTKELGLKEPFKLEQRQAEAAQLLRSPVVCLTGPAGSGKTTTVELLVDGALSLLDVPEDEIVFVAPTGRAAKRLKEVVKRKTRTINSFFRVGGENFGFIDLDGVTPVEGLRLLIIDESSMPNINLLFEMLSRLEDDVMIYFLGDVEQLPPIGFGKPFYNLLHLLPTVVLNVTKRASEGSGITFNAKRIIEESDGVIEDLEEKFDFKIYDSRDVNDVVNKILSICAYHLGRGGTDGFTPVENLGTDLSPDDIQVITPVNGKEWGTVELNEKLQDIFNPLKPRETHVSFAKTKDSIFKIRKGDRVTHTRTNESERVRMLYNEATNSFSLHDSAGVVNGDQGKVLGFFRSDKINYEGTKSDVATLRKYYPDILDRTVYVAVTYMDTDLLTGEVFDFVIFYRAEIIFESGYLLNVMSKDLYNLELAYACTTHKLQGSEAKLVLSVFFKAGPRNSGFISRNMIYTAITRAKKAGYLLGDVLGPKSAINEGRRFQQFKMRDAVLDLF